jgi:hypothetical protein
MRHLDPGADPGRGAKLALLRRAQGRRIGSLGKVPLALLLGQTDAPDTRWCDARTADGRVRNPDGDPGVADCSAPGAWLTARETFAHSRNLPLLWRRPERHGRHGQGLR